MDYQLTERGKSVAYRVGGLLILSGYGQKPVDISPSGPHRLSAGPETRTAINIAKESGYITERGDLIYFNRSGVRPIALLYATWQASLRDELEPTEHFAPVNEFDIIRSINVLEHIDNAIGGLVSSLAGFRAPPPVSIPVPFRGNLQNLIDAGLLARAS